VVYLSLFTGAFKSACSAGDRHTATIKYLQDGKRSVQIQQMLVFGVSV
jgi:hypothetical protein